MDVFGRNNVKLLVRGLLHCETEEECAAFLEDLMTTREILDISQRLAVAEMLHRGVTGSEISSTCGASSTTISRVNRSYLYGAGGYQTILKKLDDEVKTDD